jgi:hypothetical protein
MELRHPLLAPAIAPAFAFEHAHGLSGAGVEYLTNESRHGLTTRTGALGIRHLK